MNYLTARYCGEGVGEFSVMLQHYEYKEVQICFACIAEVEDMAESLYGWFRERMLWKFLRNPRSCVKWAGRDLQRFLKKPVGGQQGEVYEQVSLALLLCIGEEFLAFEQGQIRILWLNTAFGKSHLSHLMEKSEGGFCCGRQEENVAFLLATDAFCECVGEDLLREVLFVGEAKRQWQMEKRLQELVQERCVALTKDIGALMVRSGGESPGGWMEECLLRDTFSVVQYEMSERKEALLFGFERGEILGEGSFSQVIKVMDRRTGQIYACKKSRNIAMLWREYCRGKALEHPIFPRMYDFWQDGEFGYLLMEYVPGTNLKVLLERRGHFSVKQTIKVGMELAEGLLYLHEQAGLLFRDVKPENIMIRQDGRVKLLDLGCAYPSGCRPESRAGTPEFGAPEQFEEGRCLDMTCDVYALAGTMDKMLGVTAEGKRLKEILDYCRAEDPRCRIPDMRLFLNLLGDVQNGKRKGKYFYKPGVLCHKNIWERSYKTLDVSRKVEYT